MVKSTKWRGKRKPIKPIKFSRTTSGLGTKYVSVAVPRSRSTKKVSPTPTKRVISKVEEKKPQGSRKKTSVRSVQVATPTSPQTRRNTSSSKSKGWEDKEWTSLFFFPTPIRKRIGKRSTSIGNRKLRKTLGFQHETINFRHLKWKHLKIHKDVKQGFLKKPSKPRFMLWFSLLVAGLMVMTNIRPSGAAWSAVKFVLLVFIFHAIITAKK